MDTQEWPGEWLRGVLELCVLHALADGPTYGYEIAAKLSQSGLGDIKGGTLYPLLKRFEASGRVEIEWRPGESGPGRKYYLLTDQGRQALDNLTQQWQDFHGVIDGILNGRHRAQQEACGSR